jgi:hypothetical protein
MEADNNTANKGDERHAPDDIGGPFEDAYGAYARALQSAWAPSAMSRRIDESTRRFVSAMLQAWSPEERQERAQDAYSEYLRSAQEAWSPEELETRSEEAYRSYVRALKDAWWHTDTDAVEPTDLIAIAQTMLAAASLMAGARQSISQRWSAAAWMANASGAGGGFGTAPATGSVE